MIFKPETLRVAAARAEDEYSGVALDVQAELAGARLPIHINIGYGDAITPGVLDIEYPLLLGIQNKFLSIAASIAVNSCACNHPLASSQLGGREKRTVSTA